MKKTKKDTSFKKNKHHFFHHLPNKKKSHPTDIFPPKTKNVFTSTSLTVFFCFGLATLVVFGPRYRGLRAWDSSQRPARSRLGRGHGRFLGADRQTAPGDPIELWERGETLKGNGGNQQKHPGFFTNLPGWFFFKKNTRMDSGWEYTFFSRKRRSFFGIAKNVLCHILRGIGT